MPTMTSLYPSFVEHAVTTFLKVLNEEKPVFISEQHQQVF